jgi:hypothetical protein
VRAAQGQLQQHGRLQCEPHVSVAQPSQPLTSCAGGLVVLYVNDQLKHDARAAAQLTCGTKTHADEHAYSHVLIPSYAHTRAAPAASPARLALCPYTHMFVTCFCLPACLLPASACQHHASSSSLDYAPEAPSSAARECTAVTKDRISPGSALRKRSPTCRHTCGGWQRQRCFMPQ